MNLREITSLWFEHSDPVTLQGAGCVDITVLLLRALVERKLVCINTESSRICVDETLDAEICISADRTAAWCFVYS